MRQPYPDYRDSGVEWLGEVPEHWEVVRLGRFGSFFKGGGGTKADEIEGGIPCVRYGDLYTQHQFLIRGSRSGIAEGSTSDYRQLRYGDVLFAGSGETIDEIGKSAVSLIEGRAYCGGDVIVFRPHIPTDATFLGYATDCRPAAYQKSCMGRGVTVMHIYSSELKQLLIPLPPIHEQRAVAAFLDRETGRIDKLVAKKRLLVQRLDEYRTALITRTVTRGLPPEAARTADLDPSPRLKPSSVEWLGEVPEHWEVVRLKRSVDRSDVKIEAENVDEMPFVGLEHVTSWTGNLLAFDDQYKPDSLCNSFAIGDVLFAKLRPYLAKAFCADFSGLCSTEFLILKPLGYEQRYLIYLLLTDGFVSWVNSSTYGARMPRANWDFIGDSLLPLPPLQEQRAIAAFLDERTERIDRLSALVEAAIERLQEYRTALVTAAVTGKIDVREPMATRATVAAGSRGTRMSTVRRSFRLDSDTTAESDAEDGETSGAGSPLRRRPLDAAAGKAGDHQFRSGTQVRSHNPLDTASGKPRGHNPPDMAANEPRDQNTITARGGDSA